MQSRVNLMHEIILKDFELAVFNMEEFVNDCLRTPPLVNQQGYFQHWLMAMRPTMSPDLNVATVTSLTAALNTPAALCDLELLLP